MSVRGITRFLCLALIFGTLIWASLAPVWWPISMLFFRPEPTCEGKTLSEQMSPDRKWIAVLRQEICSGGLFTTTVVDVIQITRPGRQPTKANEVFAADDDGNEKARPHVEWTSPMTLQINIQNRSAVGLKKDSYEGISIRYDPDDPAARGRF